MKKIRIPFKLIATFTAMALSGCLLGEDNQKKSQSNGDEYVFMFTSDYTTGELHSLNLGEKSISNGISLHQDSRLRTDGTNLWVLEGLGADNLVKLPLDFSTSDDILFQKSLADNSNPVDIEFYSDSIAYVSLENTNKILQIDPRSGSTLKSIDLSSYAYDESNFANPGEMLLSTDSLFVLIQARNGWTVGNNGLVLLVDAKNAKVLKEYPLPLKNPTSLIKQDSKLYITLEGEYLGDPQDADKSRGILSLDLATKKTKMILSDIDLQGTPQNLQMVDKEAYVQIAKGYDESFNAIIELVKVDLSNSTYTSISSKAQGGGIAYSHATSQWVFGQRTAGQEAIYLVGENVKLTGENLLPSYNLLIVEK